MTDKQSAGSRMLASARKAREMDQREVHIRALAQLMFGRVSADVEKYLRVKEYEFALFALNDDVENGK